MALPVFDSTGIVAYMAVKFKGISDNRGWVQPSGGLAPTADRTQTLGLVLAAAATDDEDAKGPPTFDCFSPVREISFVIDRKYEGINSSGGPQSAQRPDHGNVLIKRFTDSLSPYFLEYCCNGKQMAWVHLQSPAEGDLALHIRLKDAHVVKYDFKGERYLGLYEDTQGIRGNVQTGVGHVDSIEILYTAMHMRYVGRARSGVPLREGNGGWDTGTGQAFS